MQETSTYIYIVGAAVVALAALAALVNYVISIVRSFGRNPPLAEELAKSYATKREIAELRQENKEERNRVDAILKQQFDLIRGLTDATTERFSRLESSISTWQLGVERMIGRIEGKVTPK